MENHTGDKERIAKNTVMLYIRMIIIMIVTLYTTRVVLHVLGETDYGIYNIVGSVVVSMVFIQNALMSATQRYLSYELGLKEKGDVATVFSSSMVLHLRFLLIIVLVLETIGLWFLNKVLDIPQERILAANIVYQFSILTFCLNLLRIPYNAIIISYENMSIYAILSIVETLLKLSVVIALKYIGIDKLILYGVLVFAVTLIINTLYVTYCRKNYLTETKFNLHGDKGVINKMQGFLGWNLLGGITGVATNKGPNFFMNYYLGVGINAAMGVAKQVSSAVYMFASNFQSAFNPQIVKAYAAEEKDYLIGIINKASLLSFYLLFIVTFPVVICADFIFGIWLVNVPQYAVIFCVLMLLGQVISALSSPMWMAAHATGEIKIYQIVISSINLLVLPASCIILASGFEPYFILVFNIIIQFFIFIYRLFYLRAKLGFPVKLYIKQVILKCIFLSLIIIPIPLLLSLYAETIWDYVVVMLVAITISCLVIFFIGLDRESKRVLKQFIISKITKMM